jgi:hypothetical protein
VSDFQLDCTEIVYRIVVKRGWLEEDGALKAEAFLVMRPDDHQRGLSVQRASHCSVTQCKTKMRGGYGVDSLHTGHIGELGLEVWHYEPDEEDRGGIIGLPPYYDKDNLTLSEVARAENLAGKLATQARRQLRETWRAGSSPCM